MPWAPEVGIAPLRHSLVVTALTSDVALLDKIVSEPSIGNVYIGDCPTHWSAPGIPHDDFLARFLMRTKATFRV